MFKYKRLLFTLFSGLIIMTISNMPLYAQAPYPDVFSESAVLIDAQTGKVLYGKSENIRQYPASITKLMTALIAIENQKPTDTITMSKEAVFSIERGSSHIGLDVDERISLDQGLHALLLASANEAANGIAELCDGSIAAFGEHTTRRAKELGARNTNFVNPHGLHDPNHYTTAYDMALISRELLKQPYFREIMSTYTYQIPPTNKADEIRYLSQPHKLLHERRYAKTYREDVIGGKTGFTSVAGNTLVTMAKRGDIELISVVLKSNRANLYKDTNMILDYGFENYKSISLHQQDNIVESIPMYTVKSGELIHIADYDVGVEEHVHLLTDSDVTERMINPVISLPSAVDKSVGIGDVVGSISYNYKGESLSTNNLVVENINPISDLEPAHEPVFSSKVFNYKIPEVTLLSRLSLGYTIPIVLMALTGTLFIRHLKQRRHRSIQRKSKQFLQFSKTIK